MLTAMIFNYCDTHGIDNSILYHMHSIFLITCLKYSIISVSYIVTCDIYILLSLVWWQYEK